MVIQKSELHMTVLQRGDVMSRKTVLLAVCLSVVLTSFFTLAVPTVQAQNSGPVLIHQNVDDSKLVVLSGNLRPEASKKNDRGAVPDSYRMEHMMLQLRRSAEQEVQLQKLIDELHDSSSPLFHQWLTAREYGEQFGLAQQDLDTISRWLESRGFTVNAVYENRLLIDFSGTADKVRNAFHTEIHRLNVSGVEHIANMSEPRIPAALAEAVVGVVSLHDFSPHTMYKAKVDYTFTSGGNTYYAVVPADLGTIYNLNPLFKAGLSGQGQTIALIEDSNVYSTSDWSTFRSVFGLSSYSGGSLTQVHPARSKGSNNCTDPGATTDDGEATLDVEYASAAAPSAAIELASCADTSTTFGGLIALQNLLNAKAAPPAVMSMSYGECEASNGATMNAAFSAAYQQAVTEGVSMFVSSGDSGAASCSAGYPNWAVSGVGVSGFASTPYNVAVGGTDFGDTYAGTNTSYWSSTNNSYYGSALSYVPEIPWNDTCASQLIAQFYGYGQTYGDSGFCYSAEGMNFWKDGGGTSAGSGGPSGCSTGQAAQPGIVGGTCAGAPKPSWQSLVGVPSDGVRDLPDVSLFAANGVWTHYFPFCITDPSYGYTCSGTPDTWAGGGGTSFASPIMAGIQALVNQKTGERQGNPNPTYYKLAGSEYGASGDSSCDSTLGKTASSSCTFYDVTLGDIDLPCQGYNCYWPNAAESTPVDPTVGVLSTSNNGYQPAFAATTGWDFATGIGSVNAANLVNNWPGSASFALASSPSAISILQGVGSSSSTINITPANGFSGSVKLTATGLPKGVSVSFNENPATSSSVITFKAGKKATTGTATVTIKGKSGSLSATTTITLTVNPLGNFTLTASPNALTVAQDGSGTSTITIEPTDGFDQNVSLAASGLPSGVTASFTPNPATSTTTLGLSVSGSTALGKSKITVTGSYGSLNHKTTLMLTVAK
jgi:subtilase family serine protease